MRTIGDTDEDMRANEKVEYYTITIDSKDELQWIYSATDFQNILNGAFKGSILKKLFVSLYGYLDSEKRKKDMFDFSYMGGGLLLVFERSVFELIIHAEGMMQYRIIPVYEVKIPKRGIYDHPPIDIGLNEDNFYINLGKKFELNCFEQTIDKISVKATDGHPFLLSGFDESLAEQAMIISDLPAAVELFASNGVVMNLIGDGIEYYQILLEQEKNKK